MEKGFLATGERHPAVNDALDYYNKLGLAKLLEYRESFASCAIEGNKLAEVCLETLRRLLEHEKLSDRYFLGLMWTIRSLEEKSKRDPETNA